MVITQGTWRQVLSSEPACDSSAWEQPPCSLLLWSWRGYAKYKPVSVCLGGDWWDTWQFPDRTKANPIVPDGNCQTVRNRQPVSSVRALHHLWFPSLRACSIISTGDSMVECSLCVFHFNAVCDCGKTWKAVCALFFLHLFDSGNSVQKGSSTEVTVIKALVS